MDSINPSNGRVIARIMLADEEEAIRVAKGTKYGLHVLVS
jgi:acyl-CoA reductase-like NAD-dependent aldehyde dehydrogenase